MRLTLALFITLVSITACSMLPSLPGMGGGGTTTTNRSETSSSSTTEEINGEPFEHRDGDDNDEDEERPRTKKKKKDDGDIGKTCSRPRDCEEKLCFIGRQGDMGYCTKMCNSWSDCPSHWECKRPSNAPQKICVQDNW